MVPTISVNTPPRQPISTPEALFLVPMLLQPLTIKRAFRFFVLGPDRCVVGGVLFHVAPLLIKFVHRAGAALRLMEQKFFRKSCCPFAREVRLARAPKIKLPSQS